MNHATCKEKLVDLACGELAGRALREAEAHLAACPACRAELEGLRTTRALMAGLGEVAAPRRGEAEILAAAREAVGRRPRSGWREVRWLRLAPALAVALIAGTVSYRLLASRSPTSGRSRPTETADAAGAVAAPAAPPLARAPREDVAARAVEPAKAAEAKAQEGAKAQGGAAKVARARENAATRVSEPAVAPEAEAKAGAAPAARAEAEAARVSAAAEESPFDRHRRLAAGGRLRVATATFERCPGEAWRKVETDADGHVVKLTRRGLADGRPFQAELYYGADGALSGVRYRERGEPRQEYRLDVPGEAEAIPAPALEPRQAAEAVLSAPPRCEE